MSWLFAVVGVRAPAARRASRPQADFRRRLRWLPDAFEDVAENVDWTVKSTHPLAGHDQGKPNFLTHTIDRVNAALLEPASFELGSILVDGDWAAVALRVRAVGRDGLHFDNDYCWLARFAENRIVEVRAYLDSALVAKLLES